LNFASIHLFTANGALRYDLPLMYTYQQQQSWKQQIKKYGSLPAPQKAWV